MKDDSASKVRPARAIPGPRIPLPVKVFLSYLLVLGAVAVPSWIYLRARLELDLVSDAQRQMTISVRKAAGALATLTGDERTARLRDFARLTEDRITFVNVDGDVGFDSEVDATQMTSHLTRPEIANALSQGEGVSERISDTMHVLTIYAAARVHNTKGEAQGVLRLARPAQRVHAVTDELSGFTRNVLAVAVSIALGLSALAAAQLRRPLQRLTATAKALAAGDLSARSHVTQNDEIGEAGIAIDAMAVDLRRRLATAGSADAVVAQLVDALPIPCIILEVTGEVLALNGPARTAFRLDGPHVSRRLKELVTSPTFESARNAAENDGEPEACDVDMGGGSTVRSAVHVVKRPGTAPLYVLVGAEAPQDMGTTLPPSHAVRPLSLSRIVDDARALGGPDTANGNFVWQPDPLPTALIADVDGRIARALSWILQSTHRAGKGQPVGVDVDVDTTRVTLSVGAAASDDTLARVRPLLQPLGGDVLVEGKRTRMGLPRA